MDSNNIRETLPTLRNEGSCNSAFEIKLENNLSYQTLQPVQMSSPGSYISHQFVKQSEEGTHTMQVTDTCISSSLSQGHVGSGFLSSDQGYVNMSPVNRHSICEEKDSKLNQTNDGNNPCMEMYENSNVELYSCGACNKQFDMICKLHQHLLSHQTSRSYTYNIDTKTAYPKYDSICRAVQTFDLYNDVLCGELRDTDMTEQGGHVSQCADLQLRKDELKTDPLNIIQTRRKSKRLKQTCFRVDSPDRDESMVSKIKQKSKILDKSKMNTNLENSDEVQNLKISKTDQAGLEQTPGYEEITLFPENSLKDDNVTDNENGESFKETCSRPDDSDSDFDLTNVEKKSNDSDFKVSDLETQSKESDSDLDISDSDTERKGSSKRTSGTELDRKYKCEDCDRCYKFESGLNHHRAEKHSIQSDVYIKHKVSYECRWCHETFKIKKTLHTHMKVCTKNDGLKCYICEAVFKSRKARLKHIQSHENRSDLTCRVCGKIVPALHLMQAHMKRHRRPKTVQCDQCGKSFHFKHLLKKHLVYCNNERPIKCDKCEMRFKTEVAWKHHYSVHSEDKPFVCHYCGYAGKKLSYLKRHIRTHTGEKPYSCSICGFSFTSLNGLNRHNKIHTNSKKFVCQYCGKSFTNNWNLKTHVRQHTGDTPYTCSECGKGFKQNILVKLHMKSHHAYI